MKKLPRSKKVLEYALVSISALKSFLVGWGGWMGWGGCMTNFNVYSRSISPKGRNVFELCDLLGWDL